MYWPTHFGFLYKSVIKDVEFCCYDTSRKMKQPSTLILQVNLGGRYISKDKILYAVSFFVWDKNIIYISKII